LAHRINAGLIDGNNDDDDNNHYHNDNGISMRIVITTDQFDLHLLLEFDASEVLFDSDDTPDLQLL